EGRGVVTDDVVVALLGVEAECETVDITPGVRGALLTGDGGETDTHRGDLTRLEQISLGVLGHILGDVQLTEGTMTLGVGDTLRNVLTVEVGELLKEMDVIENVRALRAGGYGDVLGGNRCAAVAGGVSSHLRTHATVDDLICC